MIPHGNEEAVGRRGSEGMVRRQGLRARAEAAPGTGAEGARVRLGPGGSRGRADVGIQLAFSQRAPATKLKLYISEQPSPA